VKPCYKCTSCKKVFEGTHPDFYMYDGMNTKNSFHIETIRKIRAEAYILPNESAVKVYVLPNAQNMTNGAFNAFLKVLEEPPEHVKFILTAPNKASLPATILSRCMCYSLNNVSDQVCLRALTDICTKNTTQEIESVISLAGGNIKKGIDILSNGDYAQCVKIALSLVGAIVNSCEYDMLVGFSECKNDKAMFLGVMEQLATLFKDALLLQIGEKVVSNEIISRLAFKLTQNQILALIDVTIMAKENIESNMSLQLVINWVCSNIFTINN
ncbi:MAG: hypothetical protein RR497_06235, partial [Oscillospiraceae bacterium]